MKRDNDCDLSPFFFTILQRAKRGAVVTLEKDKWPGGRIPYVLSAAYSKFIHRSFINGIF